MADVYGSIAQRWIDAHRHELDYDPDLLPDVGDMIGASVVTKVDRRNGTYELENPAAPGTTGVVVLERLKK